MVTKLSGCCICYREIREKKDYRENKRSQRQRSCFTLAELNVETSHADVNAANFKIIDMNFTNNKRKRKIAESLWIKYLRPTLNVQEK